MKKKPEGWKGALESKELRVNVEENEDLQKHSPRRKKGVLRNFAKFSGKHLCQGFYFNKVVIEI